MAEPVRFEDAASVVDAVMSGRDARYPPVPFVLAVDADGAPEGSGFHLPAGWPGLLVAVGSAEGAAPGGADVYLTTRPDPPPPWVCSDGGLELLDGVVRSCPAASGVLLQALRSAPEDPGAGLVLESLAYATLQGGPEHGRWLAGASRPRPDTETGPSVLLERAGDRASIILNRPGRRNAFSAAMRDELVEALAFAVSDGSLESVELSGRGASFCSGGDLAEFGTVGDPATAHSLRSARNAAWWMHLVSGRMTARVHGACVGAGVELPAFAARVVAAEGTTFRLPEVGMGLVPGSGGTVSIPRRIGAARTAWLALTGATLDAATALRWGLIDDIDDDIDDDIGDGIGDDADGGDK